MLYIRYSLIRVSIDVSFYYAVAFKNKLFCTRNPSRVCNDENGYTYGEIKNGLVHKAYRSRLDRLLHWSGSKTFDTDEGARDTLRSTYALSMIETEPIQGNTTLRYSGTSNIPENLTSAAPRIGSDIQNTRSVIVGKTSIKTKIEKV